MPTIVRIVLVVLCVAALYYLVVTLARSVSEQETGSLRERAKPWIAARDADAGGYRHTSFLTFVPRTLTSADDRA